MKKKRLFLYFAVCAVLGIALWVGLTLYEPKADVQGKVVLCIPVYGQSLALGEETVRVTDFELLRHDYGGRIINQNIGYRFGYFDLSRTKEFLKKLVHHDKRAFELSVYGMAEYLATHLGKDTLICIFPGGRGATDLAHLGKGSDAYTRFIDDIRSAHDYVMGHGGHFLVPAVCWMQGESDIAEHPGTDYKQLLKNIRHDMDCDIKAITGQSETVHFISYQTNILSRSEKYDPTAFDCPEIRIPQVMVELLRDDSLFWASGPVYPYTYVREAVHIDGVSQKRFGALEGKTALALIRGESRFKGIVPTGAKAQDSTVIVSMNVPCPPLLFDTLSVKYAPHYGFSVITPQNEDVATDVTIQGNLVVVRCSQNPAGCKVRYAANGDYMKSGCQHGPRGNLRDAQGEAMTISVAGTDYPMHNWCYQFEELVVE